MEESANFIPLGESGSGPGYGVKKGRISSGGGGEGKRTVRDPKNAILDAPRRIGATPGEFCFWAWGMEGKGKRMRAHCMNSGEKRDRSGDSPRC